MAYAQTLSLNTKYNSCELIRVEVDTARGFHSFNLVGLAHKSVSEAKDRVSSALKNCGYISPKQKNQKIVVSLAPAHIKKEGTHFDLAIALSYLLATKEIPVKKLKGVILIGELGLNGGLRPAKHILSVLKFAKTYNLSVIIPTANVPEAAITNGNGIFVANHIMEVIDWSKGKYNLKKLADLATSAGNINISNSDEFVYDKQTSSGGAEVGQIIGNSKAKLAIALSVVGNHHIFLYGPAGSGKTSLANWLHRLIPPLSMIERLEVLDIQSYFIERIDGENIRPFRTPQHNISLSKFLGGGNPVRAGELTLAHRGVLFMDEFIEFDPQVINSLREPMQNKTINVHTGSKALKLPADFTLIGATNLCHCGNFGSKVKKCYCDERQRRKYMDRLPGPIIDRIPIWSLVDSVDENNSVTKKNIEFVDLKNLIDKALKFKAQRMVNAPNNLRSNPAALDHFDTSLKNFFDIKTTELGLSRRQYANYAELARTVADIDGEYVINREHIMKALEYFPRIRGF